jgi:hypothetical protein
VIGGSGVIGPPNLQLPRKDTGAAPAGAASAAAAASDARAAMHDLNAVNSGPAG